LRGICGGVCLFYATPEPPVVRECSAPIIIERLAMKAEDTAAL
jgi:hypothetical protein